MTSDEAFLDDIIAHPEDDVPRLVYADWLDDHDQPERAEFIRVQCERAGLGRVGPKVARLELRAQELLDAHASDWLEPLGLVRDEARFERGFVAEVKLPPPEFLDRAADLMRRAPITSLRLDGLRSADGLETLAHCDALARLATLKIEYSPLALSSFLPLLQSDYLHNLRALRLGSMTFEGESLAEVFAAGCFPALRRLDLGYSDLDSGIAEILAKNPLLGQLESLRLDGNNIYNNGTRLLAASPYLGRLRHLGIAFSETTYVGLRELLESTALGRLEGLDVGCLRLADAGARLVAKSDRLTQLRELNLGNTGLTPRGARALARSSNLRHLVELQLGNEIDEPDNCIGDEGLAALAASPHVGELLELDVMGNGITAEGIAALVAAPLMPHLHALNLSCNAIGPEGAKHLFGSPHCRTLHVLSLERCDIRDEGAEALLRSPHLGPFTYLKLDQGDIGKALWRKLEGRFGAALRCKPSYEKMREERLRLE